MNISKIFPEPEQIQAVKAYIKQTWKTLYRSHQHLLEAAKDSKIEHPKGKPYLVYVSPQENKEQIEQMLQNTLSKQEWQQS